jgi:hypothetical protein
MIPSAQKHDAIVVANKNVCCSKNKRKEKRSKCFEHFRITEYNKNKSMMRKI